MRLLLDTHILIWSLEGDSQLSLQASGLIRSPSNDLFVSAASLFEIAVKIKVGKLTTSRSPVEIAHVIINEMAIQLLPIRPTHLDAYQMIPLYEDHRDPFDRLLLATAFAENLTLISDDKKFERYTDLISLIK